MSLYNVFSDKGIVNIIPFFVGLYLAYYQSLILVPILLISSVVIFYLFTVLLGQKIILQKKKYESRKELENHVFDELLKKKYGRINGLFSLAHWVLLFVTAIILYQFRHEFLVFTLFWYLVIGFAYNFIYLFLTEFDRIKKAFKSQEI